MRALTALAGLALLILAASAADAQPGCGLTGVQCPPLVLHKNSAGFPAQGRAVTGETLLMPQATSSSASINMAPGTSPSSFGSGDIWTTSTDLFLGLGSTLYSVDIGTGTPTGVQCPHYTGTGHQTVPGTCGGGGGGGSGSGLFGPSIYNGAAPGVPTSAGGGFSTWLNQRGSTVTDDQNGILLDSPSAGGADAISAWCKSYSAPYTAIGLITWPATTPGSYNLTGLALANSSSTALYLLGAQNRSAGSYTNINIITEYCATATTTPCSTVGFTGWQGAYIWIKLVDDGTNISAYASLDGRQWGANAVWSLSRTATPFGSGAPNLVCFMVDPVNSVMSGLLNSFQG
jgi:hypothetical protein